jgi:hypothetical protein
MFGFMITLASCFTMGKVNRYGTFLRDISRMQAQTQLAPYPKLLILRMLLPKGFTIQILLSFFVFCHPHGEIPKN